MQDIQIKYKVENVDEFLENLRKSKYILIGGTFEKVIRYDFEDERLANKGIFIRTKNGFSNTVTIKEKDSFAKNKYLKRENKTFEIEDCDAMKYIFEKIGLTKLYEMEKYRIIWKKEKTEIHLDELPFGIFCEICAPEKEIDKIIRHNYIKEIYNCTYWDIYHKIGSDKKDILFEPEHIFLANSII